MRPLEDTFRELLNNFFDEFARVVNLFPDGSKPSDIEAQQQTERDEQIRDEARNQVAVSAIWLKDGTVQTNDDMDWTRLTQGWSLPVKSRLL